MTVILYMPLIESAGMAVNIMTNNATRMLDVFSTVVEGVVTPIIMAKVSEANAFLVEGSVSIKEALNGGPYISATYATKEGVESIKTVFKDRSPEEYLLYSALMVDVDSMDFNYTAYEQFRSEDGKKKLNALKMINVYNLAIFSSDDEDIKFRSLDEEGNPKVVERVDSILSFSKDGIARALSVSNFIDNDEISWSTANKPTIESIRKFLAENFLMIRG